MHCFCFNAFVTLQMTSKTKKPEFSVIAGCLQGLNCLLVNFTQSAEEGLFLVYCTKFSESPVTCPQYLGVIFDNNYNFGSIFFNCVAAYFITTSRVPVEGKSSVCVICMKYRIIVLIIIIISLGQIILSYMANTSRTHVRMHTHTCVHTRACAQARPSTAVTIQVVTVTWTVCAQP